MRTLGEVIKNYRDENNLSLREFASICGVSHSYIDKLEKGIDPRNGKPVEPTLDIIERLANAMNISLYDLFIELGKFDEANSTAVKRRTYAMYDEKSDSYKFLNPNRYNQIIKTLPADKQNISYEEYMEIENRIKKQNSTKLTKKDEKDISKILKQTKEQLENSEGLMFDGEPATPEAIESILQAMEMGMALAKQKNKEKYTPKKYTKKDK